MREEKAEGEPPPSTKLFEEEEGPACGCWTELADASLLPFRPLRSAPFSPFANAHHHEKKISLIPSEMKKGKRSGEKNTERPPPPRKNKKNWDCKISRPTLCEAKRREKKKQSFTLGFVSDYSLSLSTLLSTLLSLSFSLILQLLPHYR